MPFSILLIMVITAQNKSYQVEVPDDYEYSENEGVLNIYGTNGIGALTISNYRTPAWYQLDLLPELADFIASIDDSISMKNEIVCNDDHCAAEFVDKAGQYWYVYLHNKNSFIVFCSYNCAQADKLLEGHQIKEIINSLKIITAP